MTRKLPHKTALQLHNRWRNKLNPNIKRNPWTEEEDVLLKNLVIDLGTNWVEISKYIEGRTPSSTKTRFYTNIIGNLTPEEAKDIDQKSKAVSSNFNIEETPMEIDREEKEVFLKKLYSKAQELQAEIDYTSRQIQYLEKTIY